MIQPPQPGAGPTSPGPPPAGWYADPWRLAMWRWWDGQAWTPHIANGTARKPRLPAWLSVPVIPCGLLVALTVVILGAGAPLAILLGLVPLCIVIPVLQWLDRVEPEPRSARVHAFLWGATVSVVVSSLVNGVVAASVGETAAAIFSAPVIEEGTKAIGIWYAVRRRELDGVMDGVIYAGWTALGFAVVEDFLYFSDASADGSLLELFIVRALLTPFAHPLFTAWTGLAVGLAVARGRKLFPRVLAGYALAVLSHLVWNASLFVTDSQDGSVFLGVAVVLFVVLFVLAAVALYVFRRREQARFVRLVPILAQRYGLSPPEVAVFGDWKGMLAARRSLDRRQRRSFDRLHAALARLALLHARAGDGHPAGEIDRAAEAVLVDQLQQARRP